MSTAVMEERVPYLLLSEPEAFRDLETGDLRETYTFDGTTIPILVGDEDLRFADFTLTFHKDAQDVLKHVTLDVMNMPVPAFRQIGAITGLPEDGEMDDDAVVMVRFEMLPEFTGEVAVAIELARSLGEFLDSVGSDGKPLFWDLSHWFTQSLIGG